MQRDLWRNLHGPVGFVGSKATRFFQLSPRIVKGLASDEEVEVAMEGV